MPQWKQRHCGGACGSWNGRILPFVSRNSAVEQTTSGQPSPVMSAAPSTMQSLGSHGFQDVVAVFHAAENDGRTQAGGIGHVNANGA
jgi:hypothetical protein